MCVCLGLHHTAFASCWSIIRLRFIISMRWDDGVSADVANVSSFRRYQKYRTRVVFALELHHRSITIHRIHLLLQVRGVNNKVVVSTGMNVTSPAEDSKIEATSFFFFPLTLIILSNPQPLAHVPRHIPSLPLKLSHVNLWGGLEGKLCQIYLLRNWMSCFDFDFFFFLWNFTFYPEVRFWLLRFEQLDDETWCRHELSVSLLRHMLQQKCLDD